MTGFLVKQESQDKLTIGVILPFTGDFAFFGEEIRNGINLARQELDIDYKIIYEDDESLSSVAAVKAANKLANFDNIDIAVTAIVDEAKPITHIFNNKKIPLLIVWDSNKYVYEYDYLFSTGFSTEKAGKKIANFAYYDLNLRNIAIVSHNEAWAEIIYKSFQEKFESLGGKIVLHEKHDIPDKDYKGTILKIKNSKADGVYMPLIPPTSVNFMLQAEQLDLNKQLLAGDALIQDAIGAAGSAAEDIYYTNTYVDDAEVLTEKYKEAYGSEPIDITMVSFGYNGLKTIAKAHEQNPDGLRQGLYDVIGGKTLDKEERIYQVIDGKPVLVED